MDYRGAFSCKTMLTLFNLLPLTDEFFLIFMVFSDTKGLLMYILVPDIFESSSSRRSVSSSFSTTLFSSMIRLYWNTFVFFATFLPSFEFRRSPDYRQGIGFEIQSMEAPMLLMERGGDWVLVEDVVAALVLTALLLRLVLRSELFVDDGLEELLRCLLNLGRHQLHVLALELQDRVSEELPGAQLVVDTFDVL